MSLPLNQVVVGDCGDVMADWPMNSVDCVVTDPPYRIGFMGKSWDRALPPRRAFRQIYRVLKPGALAFIMSSPRQDVLWRMLAMLDNIGFELHQSFVSWIYRTGFPKAYDVSKGIDRKLGLEREITSKGTQHSTKEFDNTFSNEREKRDIPASDLAKQWEGWKSQTGLKPAAEVVLMVNKPRSEPTIVDNVLRWGTGAVNVDACRIPYLGEKDKKSWESGFTEEHAKNRSSLNAAQDGSLPKDGGKISHLGRFPANLLISDGALDTGEITKSGSQYSERKSPAKREGTYSGFQMCSGKVNAPNAYGDEGSPFRYFDLDAWALHNGFLDVAKPSRTEKNLGLYNMPKGEPPGTKRSKPAPRRKTARGTHTQNYHPTVKPVKLMAYLIELGCPPNGIVVDPFLGSGTTGIAAKRLRRKWIGIEINPEYAEIAEARINIRGPLDQFMEAED